MALWPMDTEEDSDPALSLAEMIISKMEWKWQLAKVVHAADALRSDAESTRRAAAGDLAALVVHKDAVVAFTAQRALLERAAEAAEPEIVSLALAATQDPHGFNVALIRQLIKLPCDGVASSEEEESDDDDLEGDGSKDPVQAGGYLAAVLDHIRAVEKCIQAAFCESESGLLEPRQLEALGLLSDILKCVSDQLSSGSDAGSVNCAVALCGIAARLIDRVGVPSDFAAVSSSVRCAILDVIDEWCKVASILNTQDRAVNHDCYEDYCQLAMKCVAGPSCASLALKMIGSSESNAVKAAQDAFISRNSSYPFLQKWLLSVARLVAATIDTKSCWKGRTAPLLLPTRRQILAILSEQDDVMVEVLNLITYSVTKLEQMPGDRHPDVDRIAAELNPDLLFADLLETFAFDHLVLLDFLTSSETAMLEFILRYLRRLQGRWPTSSEVLKATGQLDRVLGTLIRLRFEIARLSTAGLFPYEAKPLIRRIEAIEDLYEDARQV